MHIATPEELEQMLAPIQEVRSRGLYLHVQSRSRAKGAGTGVPGMELTFDSES
jgi:hypothetical protein